MNKKILTAAICIALLTTAIAGCTSKTTKTTEPGMSLADATFPPYVTEAAKITETESPNMGITGIPDMEIDPGTITDTDAEITGIGSDNVTDSSDTASAS